MPFIGSDKVSKYTLKQLRIEHKTLKSAGLESAGFESWLDARINCDDLLTCEWSKSGRRSFWRNYKATCDFKGEVISECLTKYEEYIATKQK